MSYDHHLISPSEVAARLGVNKRTVERWAREGTLPAPVRLTSRVIRFRAADIEAVLERRTARQS